ncbi:hypothetical protein Rhe02_69420 [Rhizocola hellebori]|uniref:Secreted protein n=1 Tax=Rhizocola hellebori TaxID=1392758 RepID=A0A8J3VJN3_9ACTN|nr:hypothetical protein [Rhizocola hellebori]GIH08875.1 hypothetical protein Rhe02_69420 [Rhizocola hellebori]
MHSFNLGRTRRALGYASTAAFGATLIMAVAPAPAQAALPVPVAAVAPAGTVIVTTKGIPLEVQLAAKKGAGERSTVTSRPAAMATAAGPAVINCTASSDWPHISREMPSSVDGKSKIGCDAVVEYLGVQAELYRYLDGYGFSLIGIGSLDYDYRSAGPKQSTAFDFCRGIPQYYYTKGYQTVVFPAGFQPPAGTAQTQSPVIEVTC